MTTAKQAFEWVKTGHWTFRQFNEWQEAVWASGYRDGENEFDEWNSNAVNEARHVIEGMQELIVLGRQSLTRQEKSL